MIKRRFTRALAVLAAAGATGACDLLGPPNGVVQGDVRRGGTPVAGAEVVVGGQMTVSDSRGRFQLQDIAPGGHHLSVTYDQPDSGFVTVTESIIVTSGSDVGTITLPAPVTLSSSAVTDRTATLSWRPSDDSRFREYRVYMSRNQALTEETGTLVYVGTDRSATTVQVGTPYYPGQDLSPEAPLQPLTTYFFRVFVMDDRGLLGGSNLLEVNTGSFPTNQFEIEYDLVLTSSFAAQGRLGGIAWDGSCLWIVYYERGPEFLDPDPTRLVCRDLATGQTLVEHLYVDDSRSPGGLGWYGTHLWLHIVGSASQPPSTLKIIDPATFSVVDHFAAPPNTTDMAWDGQSLLVAISRNRIEFIDPLWGGWLREVYTPFRFQSLKGVAYRDGEIWALSGAHPQLAVLSPDGRQIGVGYTEVLRPGYRNAAGGYLTFVGDQLVLAEEARIYIFDLAPR